jgi:hypothetical protein
MLDSKLTKPFSLIFTWVLNFSWDAALNAYHFTWTVPKNSLTKQNQFFTSSLFLIG